MKAHVDLLFLMTVNSLVGSGLGFVIARTLLRNPATLIARKSDEAEVTRRYYSERVNAPML